MCDTSSAVSNSKGVPRRQLLAALATASVAWIAGVLGVPVARLLAFPLSEKNNLAGWTDLGSLSDFSDLSEPVAREILVERRDGWQVSATQQTVYVLPAKSETVRVL